MVVGACSLRLHLPGCASLKEKRGLLKALLARLHREFNVAAAETDLQDIWQSAEVSVVTVANDGDYVRSLLERVVAWIEHNRPEIEVMAAAVELR